MLTGPADTNRPSPARDVSLAEPHVSPPGDDKEVPLATSPEKRGSVSVQDGFCRSDLSSLELPLSVGYKVRWEPQILFSLSDWRLFS